MREFEGISMPRLPVQVNGVVALMDALRAGGMTILHRYGRQLQ